MESSDRKLDVLALLEAHPAGVEGGERRASLARGHPHRRTGLAEALPVHGDPVGDAVAAQVRLQGVRHRGHDLERVHMKAGRDRRRREREEAGVGADVEELVRLAREPRHDVEGESIVRLRASTVDPRRAPSRSRTAPGRASRTWRRRAYPVDLFEASGSRQASRPEGRARTARRASGTRSGRARAEEALDGALQAEPALPIAAWPSIAPILPLGAEPAEPPRSSVRTGGDVRRVLEHPEAGLAAVGRRAREPSTLPTVPRRDAWSAKLPPSSRVRAPMPCGASVPGSLRTRPVRPREGPPGTPAMPNSARSCPDHTRPPRIDPVGPTHGYDGPVRCRRGQARRRGRRRGAEAEPHPFPSSKRTAPFGVEVLQGARALRRERDRAHLLVRVGPSASGPISHRNRRRRIRAVVAREADLRDIERHGAGEHGEIVRDPRMQRWLATGERGRELASGTAAQTASAIHRTRMHAVSVRRTRR